jgi:hypothetical protein
LHHFISEVTRSSGFGAGASCRHAVCTSAVLSSLSVCRCARESTAPKGTHSLRETVDLLIGVESASLRRACAPRPASPLCAETVGGRLLAKSTRSGDQELRKFTASSFGPTATLEPFRGRAVNTPEGEYTPGSDQTRNGTRAGGAEATWPPAYGTRQLCSCGKARDDEQHEGRAQPDHESWLRV